MSDAITLEIRRVIRASASRLFSAWTEPSQLRSWWGPEGVSCREAELDLRPGGRYRIVNVLPDGSEVVIAGEFERVDRDRELVYTWSTGGPLSRVTVRFEPRDNMTTEIIVVHERIADPATAEDHRAGWLGCLDGLVEYLSKE